MMIVSKQTTKREESEEMAKDKVVKEPLTDAEKLTLAGVAFTSITAAKTADDVRDAFRASYMSLGHKVLGRILLGQTAEKALRITPTS